ncbi:MAG: right-handed parallel beta-helix repeat-containing protein [Planctomycetes bacterium]|nr:right-handed parallel beta-helix repeat-containing protein [Planctomycetota bacterium]
MRKTGLTLLAMSLLIGEWSLRHAEAQFNRPSTVTVYNDDFSSNRVRHDSWTHSVIWVEGSFPPPKPYLVYSSQGSFDRELVFRSSGGFPAELGYCFPIQPDQVMRAIPLELTLDVDVRLLAQSPPRHSGSGYLQYRVSADGVNWSAPTFMFSGRNRLSLGELRDNRYVLFSGASVAIDNLRATTVYRPAPAGDLRVPGVWPTIQDAVNAAGPRQRVVVADGVYPGPISFLGKNIVVMSENGPDECTIDCQGQTRGVIFVQGETRSAVLDGFTIVNGREEQGGAIFCRGDGPSITMPTISNCVFRHCEATWSLGAGQGGAIYCAQAMPLIRDCLFLDNLAGGRDGGQGGAVYIAQDAAAEIVRCRFENNRTREGSSPSNSGGGVFVNTSRFTAQVLGQSVLRNCVFYNNYAADDGGAVYLRDCTSLIANCTIAGNRADNNGGGIFAYLSSSSAMNLVRNSIVWDNSPDNIARSGSYSVRNLEVEFSDVGQGWVGQGNLNVDPLFADPGQGDFHLRSYAGRWDPDQEQWVHDAQIEINPSLDGGGVQDPVGAERIPHGDLINLGAYGGTAQASRGDGPLVLHVAKGGDDQNVGLSRSEPFATIQAAVEWSLDGYVVMVWPGIYREEVVYGTKAITIQSAADAAVVRPASGYAFSFYQGEGPDSVLRNMILVDCPKGGVFCTSSAPTIQNVTIVNCMIGINAEENASQTEVANCIFFRNSVADLLGCTATYSCSPREGLPGEDNIRADPLLMDVERGDFHLQSRFGTFWPDQNAWFGRFGMSPCIDAGNPEIDPGAEPPANGALLNLGAHGGTGQASMAPSFVEADYNGDGVIDLEDYILFARQWQSP